MMAIGIFRRQEKCPNLAPQRLRPTIYASLRPRRCLPVMSALTAT